MFSSTNQLSVVSWHKLALLSSTGDLLVEGLCLDSLQRIDFFCYVFGILWAPTLIFLDWREILAKL